MEHIHKVLAQLEAKLERQKEAVATTEAHIKLLRDTNLGGDLLEQEKKKGAGK